MMHKSLLCALLLSLSACGGKTNTATDSMLYKLNKRAPDARKVVVHKPLTVPSDLNLTAPQEAEKPQKITDKKAASSAFVAAVPNNLLHGKATPSRYSAYQSQTAQSILTGGNNAQKSKKTKAENILLRGTKKQNNNTKDETNSLFNRIFN